MESFLGIKDRQLRKDLIQSLQECKSRYTNIISVLRGVWNFDCLSNHVIAQLNDYAYKGIQSNGLQKLIDKRAIQNQEMYENMEAQITDIKSKI